MDLTENRLYPFPQCQPPLIKDEANAPVQTRALAEAIDADLDTVSVQIREAFQLPTTILRITAATSIPTATVVPFNVVEYDNQGWATDSTITVPTAGVYLVTGFVHSVLLSNVQGLQIQFRINSTLAYLQGTSPPVTDFGRMTASGVLLLSAGDVVGLRIHYSGTDPSDFDNAWFSVTRMVEF